MEQRLIGDPEFYIILEEEKRLCEKNVEFVKGISKKGIAERNGILSDKDSYNPAIKLNRKLENKELYQIADSKIQWKLITDVRESKKLIAFLEIKFPNSNASELHFCLEMDLKLYRAGNEKIIDLRDKKFKAAPYHFEKNTDTLLQWLQLLIGTKNIDIMDGNDPSISIEGVPVDIPISILGFFDEYIKNHGKGGKDPVIILRDRDHF